MRSWQLARMDMAIAENPPDLIDFYRALLAVDPAQPAIAALLASALIDRGDAAAGLEMAMTASIADDPALAFARGRALKALGRFEPAAKAFADAVAQGAESPPVFVALGNCLAEAGRLGEAACWFERAATHDESGTALANLGIVRARLGQEQEALAAARAALCRDPEMIDAHRTLAVLLAACDPEAAALHRAASFARQQIFAHDGPPGAVRVLVLTCVPAASLPIGHLLPRSDYALTEWFIDHATEASPDLARCDIIFNAIGEADLMPRIAPAVERILAAGLPVLNPPDRVARTGRADLPGLLAGIEGAMVPVVMRIEGSEPVLGIDLPVLIRPLGSHGGEGLCRVETDVALAQALSSAQGGHVTRYVDYRSSDGFFRKYRMIFVDRVVYPYHLAIGPDWIVHYWTAGMETDAARREEEARFLADPFRVLGPVASAAIDAIARRLDLDYAGIDFSLLPDGRVLVFEANAAMLVHPEHDAVFAYRNAAVGRILDAFAAMILSRSAPAKSIHAVQRAPDDEGSETDQADEEPKAKPVWMDLASQPAAQRHPRQSWSQRHRGHSE